MQKKSVKIFNFGLPRTGTTSFHLFMKENGYKTVHTNDGFINKCFPKDYFEFIQDSNNLDNNLIKKYISDNEVFSDLPWYSYKLRKKIIEKYKNNPNVYFVATTRKKEDWIRSIKTIIPHIKSESEKQFHEMEYNGILKEGVTDDKLSVFFDEFHSNMDKNIILLSLENTKSIKKNLSKITKINLDIEYPISNKSDYNR